MTIRTRRAVRSVRPTVVLALLAAATLSACGGSPSSTTSSTLCPLRGTPAPGGHAAARAALAVKVDNAPAARPPTGLADADVVVEEPVEGGLTRLVAVFQCQPSTRIEPVRSARLVDPDLLQPLSSVGLAHAGGIQPALDKLAQSGVTDVGDTAFPTAYHRDPKRRAPSNEYTSTADLWPHLPATAPTALFTYSSTAPTGAGGTQVRIPFSGYSNVTWRYDTASGLYQRYYGSRPALDSSGHPLVVDDVVVERVVLSDSGFVEDATGQHENNVDVVSGGPAQLFRDGVLVTGHWDRSSGGVNSFTDDAGHAMKLRPGRTWLELVPTTVATAP